MVKKILFLLLINIISVLEAQTTYSVASLDDFNTSLSTANSGDTIEWEDDIYSDVYMNITKSGITVQAETSGGVIFNGASKVEIHGDNVNFLGFQYVEGDIVTDNVARIYGSNILFENINIAEYTSYKYLIVEDSSQYTTIKNCNFEHRVNNPDQNILSILVSQSQSGFHKVQYCSFKNFNGEPDEDGSSGDAGVEPIRIGVSTTANYSSKSIVEYCYFTSCEGDGEIISHKATDCIYRYNTFEANETSELVLRHGDNAIVYGNFFINTARGIRVREGNGHLIYNNYFGNLSSKSIHLVNSNSDPVENITIAYNTFVDTQRFRLSDGDLDEGEVYPTNITLINNIFSDAKSSSGLFRDVTGTETWIGNIVDDSDVLGITAPDSGITYADPQLFSNSESLYEIGDMSPAIDSAEDNALFPFATITDFAYDNEIALDILSNDRPSTETMKDVGCQEYDGETLLKAYVSEANTGPYYLMDDSSLSNENEELITKNFNLFPNPLVDNIINLDFNIEQESDVKVDIYDVSGKKLSNLIDASYNSGSHNFNSQLNLEAGLYLLSIKVSSAGTTATKIEKILKK